MGIAIMQTWAKAGEAFRLCDHARHIPVFNPAACLYQTTTWVREKYPRFEGLCASCGQRAIIYADLEHMLAGGWEGF